MFYSPIAVNSSKWMVSIEMGQNTSPTNKLDLEQYKIANRNFKDVLIYASSFGPGTRWQHLTIPS